MHKLQIYHFSAAATTFFLPQRNINRAALFNAEGDLSFQNRLMIKPCRWANENQTVLKSWG